MNKIIFLDFDGVVNNFAEPDSFRKLSVKNVKVLNRLIKLTNASIVITSVWRINYSMEVLKQVLINAAFKYPESVIDVTPLGYGYRGKEIKEWLDQHPEVSEFVILDDDSDMEPYMDKLVRINSSKGLTYNKIASICQILKVKGI